MTLNLPNRLTLLRLLLTPLVIVLIVVPLPVSEFVWRFSAAFVFSLLAVTDTVDGHLARKRGQITEFGKLMDPLADKLLILGSLTAILIRQWGERPFRLLLLCSLAVILLRELAVTVLRLLILRKGGRVIPASLPGKIKTTAQDICVVLLLLAGLLPQPFADIVRCPALILTALLTVWSGLCFWRGNRLRFSSAKK